MRISNWGRILVIAALIGCVSSLEAENDLLEPRSIFEAPETEFSVSLDPPSDHSTATTTLASVEKLRDHIGKIGEQMLIMEDAQERESQTANWGRRRRRIFKAAKRWVKKAGKSIGKGLKKVGKGIKKAAKAVGKGISAAANRLKQMAIDLYNRAKKLALAAVRKLKELVNRMKKLFSGRLTRAMAKLGRIAKQSLGMFKQMMSGLKIGKLASELVQHMPVQVKNNLIQESSRQSQMEARWGRRRRRRWRRRRYNYRRRRWRRRRYVARRRRWRRRRYVARRRRWRRRRYHARRRRTRRRRYHARRRRTRRRRYHARRRRTRRRRSSSGSSRRSGGKCASFSVPNVPKTKIQVTKKPFIKIPQKKIKICPPSFLAKAKKWLMNTGKKIALKVLKAFNSGYDYTRTNFEASDQMLKGPACHTNSFAIQITISGSAGAAKGVGGSISAETGFQVGCMDFGGGKKRWVLVPMWGIVGAISAGYASPGAAIDANLYVYYPYTYYAAFGHEISIGAAGGSGLPKPGHGGALDIIFGCCTSPLSKNGVPLDIVTKTASFKIPIINKTWRLKYPVSPYLRVTPTGGHIAVQLISTEVGEEVRLIQPATHKEIDLDALEHAGNNPDEGLLLESKEYLSSMKKAPMKDSEDPIQKLAKKCNKLADKAATLPKAVQDQALVETQAQDKMDTKAKAKEDAQEDEEAGKAEFTINLAYARACRMWDPRTVGKCFNKFNP